MIRAWSQGAKMRGTTLAAGALLAMISSGALAGSPAAPTSNWTGLYAGAQIGVGFAPFTDEIYDWYGGSPQGALAGGYIGYTIPLAGKWLAGIEADAAWDDINGASQWTATYHVDWDASLRARIGYDLGQMMPYVTAGISMAGTSSAYYGTTYPFTRTGFTVGAGSEFALSPRFSTRIEVRYSDYGSTDYGYVLHVTDTSLRAGLGYHF